MSPPQRAIAMTGLTGSEGFHRPWKSLHSTPTMSTAAADFRRKPWMRFVPLERSAGACRCEYGGAGARYR